MKNNTKAVKELHLKVEVSYELHIKPEDMAELHMRSCDDNLDLCMPTELTEDVLEFMRSI